MSSLMMDMERDIGTDHLLGLMFGNVDEAGDLNVDYLDDDAKDHLSALALGLGSSFIDIDLSHTIADAIDQDYDHENKADDAVNYDDIDELYEEEEGAEIIQQATFHGGEEDYLLSKNQYFSAFLEQKTCVFDEENYDEDEQEDLQEPLSDQKSHTFSLPVLYQEDGMTVFRFSEIFGNHEPMNKREKKSRRYTSVKERDNKSFDAASGIVEEDDEAFLRGRQCQNLFTMKEASSVYDDDGSQLFDVSKGINTKTAKAAEQWKGSFLSLEPMNENEIIVSADMASGREPPCPSFCPLEQQDWEKDVIWGNSSLPSTDGSSRSFITSEVESEDHVQEIVSSEVGSQNLGSEFLTEADENYHHRLLSSSYPIVLESFGSGEFSDHANILEKKHPQQLRLESCLKVDVSSYSDGKKESATSKLLSQNMDMLEDSWLDKIIWNPSEAASKPKLILDLQDEHMLFEFPESKDVRHLHAHAGAMIVERFVKPLGGDSFDLTGQSESSCEFNLSNDKYYSNCTATQQSKSHSKNRTANTDLGSFAGDLENLLDGEEFGVESYESRHNEKNAIKGLKMRRHPPARKSVVCRACGQMGHIRTNRNCPRNKEDSNVQQVESIDDPGKRNIPDPSTHLSRKTSIKNIIRKGATSIALVKSSENSEKAGSTTEVLPLKLKCGAESAGPQSVNKISKIVSSNKLKVGDVHVKPLKLIIKPLAEVERDQPRKKIIIKLPRGDTTVEQVKQESSSGMQENFRKAKMMTELSSVEMQRKQDSKRLAEEVGMKRKAYEVQGSSKNDLRLPGRDCFAKKQSVVELGTYAAEYAPQTKRRRGGAPDEKLLDEMLFL